MLAQLLDARVDWWLQLAANSPTVDTEKAPFLPWNEGYCLLSKDTCLLPSALVKLGSDYRKFASSVNSAFDNGFITCLSNSIDVDDTGEYYLLSVLIIFICSRPKPQILIDTPTTSTIGGLDLSASSTNADNTFASSRQAPIQLRSRMSATGEEPTTHNEDNVVNQADKIATSRQHSEQQDDNEPVITTNDDNEQTSLNSRVESANDNRREDLNGSGDVAITDIAKVGVDDAFTQNEGSDRVNTDNIFDFPDVMEGIGENVFASNSQTERIEEEDANNVSDDDEDEIRFPGFKRSRLIPSKPRVGYVANNSSNKQYYIYVFFCSNQIPYNLYSDDDERNDKTPSSADNETNQQPRLRRRVRDVLFQTGDEEVMSVQSKESDAEDSDTHETPGASPKSTHESAEHLSSDNDDELNTESNQLGTSLFLLHLILFCHVNYFIRLKKIVIIYQKSSTTEKNKIIGSFF